MTALGPRKISAYDLVVVGGGNAGLTAAIEASNRGARVMLVEKGPKVGRGGNSRFTYGDFRVITSGLDDFRDLIDREDMIGGDVEIEEQTAEFFFGEAMRLSQGLADRRLTSLFVERSQETVRWLKQEGVRWTLNPRLAFRKGERILFSAGNANIQSVGSGSGYMEMLYGIAERKGVDIAYDTAAHELVLAADGSIGAVIARSADGYIEIPARSAVLCCGGFQACPRKRRAYLGENMDLVLLRGSPYNTGDWIDMTGRIGAQFTGHWGGCHASPVSVDEMEVDGVKVTDQRYSYPFGIMVNRDGNRFVDEGENFYGWNYNRYGKDILRQPGAVAFQVFDRKVESLVTYDDAAQRYEAGTLENLAGQAGIDPARFAQTVAAFNAAIVNDEAPFVPYALDGRHTAGLTPAKSNWACRIDTPPFRAYPVICGLTMTYGGLKTDEKARVIDTSNRPIEGLYAVGEITGGYFYHTYLGGSGLIRGAVMGRIAGAEAAARR